MLAAAQPDAHRRLAHHPAAMVGGCFDQANGPGNAASGKPKPSRAAWSK
jgi:hypothetical protein